MASSIVDVVDTDDSKDKELDVFRNYYSDLYNARWSDLPGFAARLCSEQLISVDVLEEVETSTCTVLKKKTAVLKALRCKLKCDHSTSSFMKFVRILLDGPLHSIGAKMLSELHSNKEHQHLDTLNIHRRDTSKIADGLTSASSLAEDIHPQFHLHSSEEPKFNTMRKHFGLLKMRITTIVSDKLEFSKLQSLIEGYTEFQCFVNRVSTTKEMMDQVTRMCTLIDIGYIKVIANAFEIKEMTPLIKNYDRSLEEFFNDITLDLCCSQSFEFNIPGAQLTCDTIEFILEWTPKEHLLYDIKLLLSKAFEKMATTVKVVAIDDSHSILVKCYAHRSVSSVLIIKSQENLQELRDLGVKKLTIGYCVIWDSYNRDKEVEILVKDIHLLKSQVDSYCSSVAVLKDENAELKEQNSEYMAEITSRSIVHSNLFQDYDGLKKKLRNVEELYKSANVQLAEKEAKIHEMTYKAHMQSPQNSVTAVSRSCSASSNEEAEIPEWITHSSKYITHDDVIKFLKSLSLDEYISSFQRKQIDGPMLLRMTHESSDSFMLMDEVVHNLEHQTLIKAKFFEFVEKESGIEWGANHLMMTSPTPDQCKAVMKHVKEANFISIYLWNCSSLSTLEVISAIPDTSVSRLRFYSSEVDVEKLQEIVMLNVSKCHLQEIRLWSCNLIPSDVQIICSVADESNLKDLNLHSNHNLNDQGAKHLAEFLRANKSLEQLDISECNITDSGVEFISVALKVNCTLQTLVLSNNVGITDVGAEKIGEMIKINTSLKELQIGRTSIGEKGTNFLCEALTYNSRMSRLVLPSQLRDYCTNCSIPNVERVIF